MRGKNKLDRLAAGVERAQCAPWSVWVGKASAHASPSRHCRRRALSPPARGTASEMPPKSDAVVKDAFPEGLQRGDLVFAKIYGFPWWPAVVRGVRHAYEPEEGEEPTVRVRFCADPTNYHATPSTLERFADKPEWTDVKTVTWKFKSPNIRKKWEERTLAVAVAVAATLTVTLTLSPGRQP